MMEQAFFFSGEVKNLLFYGWNTHNSAEFVATCIFVFILAFCIEGVKVCGNYASEQANRNPLHLGERRRQGRPDFLNPLAIPASVAHVKRRRLGYKLIGFICYLVVVVLGYLLMLCVMSFNAWFIIVGILGYVLGYYIFVGLNLKVPGPHHDDNTTALTSSGVLREEVNS